MAPPQDASANSDPLQPLLGWLANRIAAITGQPNWWQAPRTTLEAAGQHVENAAGNPHGTTAADVGALRSIDGVRNDGGNVDLVQDGAINVTPDDTANTVTFGVDVTDTTQPGVAEVATDAETDDGLDGSRIVPPSALRKRLEKDPFKLSVRAATTANVALSGAQTVDGVALAAGNRVLVKNQANGAENGIWVAQVGAWVRASDADAGPKLPPRTLVVVQEGTSYAGTIWTLSTSGAITIGTTALAFQQLSGGGSGGAVDASGSQKGVSRLDRNPQVSTDPVALGQNSLILETHIWGLDLVWNGPNDLSAMPGSAWVPGLGRVLNVPAEIRLASVTFPANSTAWYYVYVFENAGVPAMEVSAVAPVSYKGSARIKGGASPDNTRRYIGAVLPNGAAAPGMYGFVKQGTTVLWREGTGAAPFLRVNGLDVGAKTTVECSPVIPPTSRIGWFRVRAAGDSTLTSTPDDGLAGTTVATSVQHVVAGDSAVFPHPLSPTQQISYFTLTTTGLAYIAVTGYEEAR